MRTAEMELKKGQNMLEHEDEIFGRPKRTWFQTEKEKEKAACESDDCAFARIYTYISVSSE